MESDSKLIAIVMAAVIAVTGMLVVALAPGSDAAESLPEGEEYDVDFGPIWSMSVQCVFDGTMAQTIEWDFGDGTPVSNEFNPQHTYSVPDVYTIKQTVTNPEGTDVTYYRVDIRGYPYIDFVSNGGTEVERIQQTTGGVNSTPATEPAQPTREGYVFTGLYVGDGCPRHHHWSDEVTSAITLYAGWVEEGTTPGGDDDADDNGGELMWLIGAIVCGILAVVCLAVALKVNEYAAIGTVVFAILAVVCALFYLEVI